MSSYVQVIKKIKLEKTTLEKLIEIDKIYNDIQHNLKKSIRGGLNMSFVEETDDLFSKNPCEVKRFRPLPASEFKDEIVTALRENQVIIVKSKIKHGKSTMISQYILEDWLKYNISEEKPCRIVIAQPKRIEGLSLGERVSYEMGENISSITEYEVRVENSNNLKTERILNCTSDVLLRKMAGTPDLYDCSHVILDEAHERGINTDLLMNLLRYALDKNKNLKVIVISATIHAEIFQKYFNNAPIISGFTHPVKQHFIDKHKSVGFSRTLQMCEGRNPSVVVQDVIKTIRHVHKTKGDGAILCYLPGWEDINTISNILAEYCISNLRVFCLHSRLTKEERKLAFPEPSQGIRKVILSTNIAETYIINDVVYVIDTGIRKESKFNSDKGVTSLDNSWIPQTSVQQRKEQAGQCQSGEIFHLYSKEKSKEFDECPIPEIQRTSLTKIVLDSKVYSNNMNAVDFFSRLITPPSNDAIRSAVRELTDLELLDSDENLTPLGRMLANFKLEPKLAKTMVNAMVFKCVTPIVDIVTLFSQEKELFVGGLYDKDKIRIIKQKFSKNSDHLALMEMFEEWIGYVKTDGGEFSALQFCEENNLVETNLKMLLKLRKIRSECLRKFRKGVLPLSDDFSNSDELIKGVLLSGVGTLIERIEKVKGKKKSCRLFTRNNHIAQITSESVNAGQLFSSDYLIYINEMWSKLRKTSLIRETSLVSLLTVLLFKNNKIILQELKPEEHSSNVNSTHHVLLTLENTEYRYICRRNQAKVIKKCKEVLQSMLQYYIFQLTQSGKSNPVVNKSWNRILCVLNEMLKEVQI